MQKLPEDAHSSPSSPDGSLTALQVPADEILTHASRYRRRSGHSIWLLCTFLLPLLASMLWWTERRIDQLSGQLVATQDSFARISEGASAELQAIDGRASHSIHLQRGLVEKVSTLQQQLEQMQQQQRRLQQLLEEQDRLLPLLQEQASQLTARLDQLQAEQNETASQQTAQLEQLRQQQASLMTQSTLQLERLQVLEQREDPLPRLASLEQQLPKQESQLQTQLEAIQQQLAAGRQALAEMREQTASSNSLQRLQDEVLVLRSQLDERPEAGIERKEFDRFRLQTTRHITTLQEQWRNLQRQQP